MSQLPEVVRRFLFAQGFHEPTLSWCSSGLSGARVAKVCQDRRSACLKGWPLGTARQRITEIHHVLRRVVQQGCSLVPSLFTDASQQSFVADAEGRFWELAQWVEGSPQQAPADDLTLRRAGTALAQLHLCFRQLGLRRDTAPNIRTRLDRLKQLHTELGSSLPQRVRRGDMVGGETERETLFNACRLWELHGRSATDRLQAFVDHRLELHYVLRDVHRDHWLVQAEGNGCFIDFDAMRVDTPLTDLARLLGSLGGPRTDAIAMGTAAYAELIPLEPLDLQIVAALDQTNSLAAMLHWTQWILAGNLPGGISRQQALTKLREHMIRIQSMEFND